MKLLLVSCLGFPINPASKYVGIERLVRDFSLQLTKFGHHVSVIGPEGSEYPEGVTFLPAPCSLDAAAELKAFQLYQGQARSFDCIHDFSHQHYLTRYGSRLPVVSAFWHAPALAKYPKAPYNIVAPSRWAAREFERVYGQKARVQDIIVVDPEVFKPNGKPRGDRFMCLGRNGPEKGHLNSIRLCKKLGLKLDVCGARGLGREHAPLDEYETAMMALCDGDQIRFQGEVDEGTKVDLMQNARGLLYITDHPEVTNHKLQEAMMCGCPVVAPRLGAQPEIVTHESNGFLCATAPEYERAIRDIDDLPVHIHLERVRERWSPETVVGNYVKLYQEVANGTRW